MFYPIRIQLQLDLMDRGAKHSSTNGAGCLAAGKRGAAPADAAAAEPAAWELDFNIWRPTSPAYRGTDTELTMKLTTFWFFCNRPTVGALIGLSTDLAAATAVAKPGDASAPAEKPAAAQEAAPQQPVCNVQGN